MELLKMLSEASGIPGRERAVREVIAGALQGTAAAISIDRMGNLIAHVAGDGPVVAVAAHMDEIGFLVSHIEKDSGFLRIHPLGGFDPQTLVAQRVVVHASERRLPGCIGRKPVHILTDEERKKPVEMKDLFVDLGLPEEQVRAAVAIGDVVTLHQSFSAYGDILSGKALDDRVGIYVAIEAMRRVEKLACDLYFIATVQEEVGLRGAHVAGFAVQPEIGIALDVTAAADLPEVPERQQITRLGRGAAIKLSDSSSISHPALVRLLRRLADEQEIPYQMEILPRGGTDAGALQLAREGAAVATISVPTRYVHSVVETVHRDDVEAAIRLLVAFLEAADGLELGG